MTPPTTTPRLVPTEEQAEVCEATRASSDSLMIKAYAGCAKALRNDQRVVTPSGMKQIGELTVYDTVFGSDGKPYEVVGVFPQGVRELYEIRFSDGTKVVASDDHIWQMQRTDDRLKGKTRLVKTIELAAKPRALAGPKTHWGDGTRAYWFAPMTKPVEFPKRKLLIDPWLLGILLGDGCLQKHSVTFSSADEEIVSAVKVIVGADYKLLVHKTSQSPNTYDYRISTMEGARGIEGKTGIFNPLLGQLQSMGLSGCLSHQKSIPNDYKLSCVEDRLALLQGLMDSDGYADASRAVFTSSSVSLAKDLKFVVESLGGTATENQFTTSGMLAFRIHMKLPIGMSPFRLERKKVNYWTGQRPPYRAIEAVTKIESAEATCISVKSPDNLFLTEGFIPTHNTSTLEMAGARIKSPALALAFNKSIATELGKRFAGNFEVKTMNGFGFGALVRSRPEIMKWDLDTKKMGKIISGLAKERKIDLDGEAWDGLRRFVSAAMTAGIAPDGEGLLPDTAESWRAVAESLWLPEAEFEFYYELGHDVLRKNNEATRRGVVSFDDQVYYPTLYGAKFPQFPVMLVDEAQDLNALNHAMLAKAMRPDGRLLVCGDPKQSIYGFRGSVNDSMGKIAGLRPNWQNLPLTLTFRCPKAIVARQQGHAPGFRAYHGNAEGVAARWEGDPADPMKFEGWNWHTVVQAIPGQGSSMAILCRNNGPLFDMAFKLLRQGIGVVMLGRDLGKGLVLLIRKLAKPEVGIAEFMIKLRDWRETEETMAKANDQDERVAGIVDRYECIVAVAQGAGCRTVAEIVAQLERLFARESGVVTLGSIHRAKGLEWDLVIHLDPWRIPSKQAKRAAQQGDMRQMEQEWNLRYVAETRTKHTLIEADLRDFIP